jgi:predicted ATP-grasp superfamily ATP-dependent carboligase
VQRTVTRAIALTRMHDMTAHQVYYGYDLQGVTVRIFAFEYVTGGAMVNESVPRSLAYEGNMMLGALIEDLAALPNIEVMTLRDARFGEPEWIADVRYVRTEHEFQRGWQRLLAEADAVWPVAPETGTQLERLSRNVIGAGKLLLNSRPEAVQVAASKIRTAQCLAEHGLPVVPTCRLLDHTLDNERCWVVKPDDGVGCLGARICRSLDELEAMAYALGGLETYVIQPFVKGTPASLCMLCRDGDARLLSCNLQRVVVANDEFHLLGCIVNGMAGDRAPYARMARQIAAALPGLWGLVGVDFIASEHGPLLLEINPRLTTSYAGLKSSLKENPAALVLRLIDEQDLAPEAMSSPEAIDVSLEVGDVA